MQGPNLNLLYQGPHLYQPQAQGRAAAAAWGGRLRVPALPQGGVGQCRPQHALHVSVPPPTRPPCIDIKLSLSAPIKPVPLAYSQLLTASAPPLSSLLQGAPPRPLSSPAPLLVPLRAPLVVRGAHLAGGPALELGGLMVDLASVLQHEDPDWPEPSGGTPLASPARGKVGPEWPACVTCMSGLQLHACQQGTLYLPEPDECKEDIRHLIIYLKKEANWL